MSVAPLLRLLTRLCEKHGIKTVYLQFFLYLFVGGTCSVCDVGGFWLLHAYGVPLLMASATSFTLSTILNYFLSYLFVFERGRFSKHHEFMRIFLISLVGLGLNTLLVYLFVAFAAFPGLAAKIVAIPIVLFWNFWGRRVFVFRETVPV